MTIMVDTGVFYALFDRSDIHHLDSLALLTDTLEGKFGAPYTTDLVVLESTLLLKGRGGPGMARAFIKLLNKGGISVMLLDDEVYAAALTLFDERTETLSLCDAASLVLMKRLGIQKLATYDERSFGAMTKQVIGRGYFDSLDETRQKVMSALDKTRATK
ncbi:MAG: PIN domain-containing protein [Thaumarchaeota archaeon]|nr:PIN domain-containing protein [Nitrososphaerota archaeon]